MLALRMMAQAYKPTAVPLTFVCTQLGLVGRENKNRNAGVSRENLTWLKDRGVLVTKVYIHRHIYIYIHIALNNPWLMI